MGSLRWCAAGLVAALASTGAVAAKDGRAGSCRPAPTLLLTTLRQGLRPTAHAQLRSAFVVRARGSFTGVFASGAYFVSAAIGRSRVATWAVSPSVLRNGQGAVFGIGRVARKVSRFGSSVPPALVAGWGVSMRTTGYAASRACVAG